MNSLQTARLIVFAAGFASILRAEILPGDDTSKVIAELGEPKGSIRQGKREVMFYSNGTIEFRDGKALKIALSSPEEVAAHEAREAEAKRIEQDARQASVFEGEEKTQALLKSERFKSMPPGERVRSFDRIRKLHPGTPMPPEYGAARNEIIEQAKIAEAEKTIRDKEERHQELKDAQSKLSSGKRRRFNRTNSDEIKSLEKELAKP